MTQHDNYTILSLHSATIKVNIVIDRFQLLPGDNEGIWWMNRVRNSTSINNDPFSAPLHDRYLINVHPYHGTTGAA